MLIQQLIKTAFYLAVERENIEIIKLLINHDKLDINLPYILELKFLWNLKSNFQITFAIYNQIIQQNSKSNYLMIFWNKILNEI